MDSISQFSDKGAQHYSAVDVGKLHAEKPENITDTLSLGGFPPRPGGMFWEVGRYFGTRFWFLLISLPWITAKFLLLYGLLFAPLFIFTSKQEIWQNAYWTTLVHELDNWIPITSASNALAHPEYLLLLVVAGIAWIYFLNLIDVFWWLHFGRRDRPGLLVVPTWLMYTPLSSTSERMLPVDTNSFHSGSLTVMYGFTQDHFFLRGQGDHVVTVIDFSAITSIDVDTSAHNGWWGNHGTPPVRIVLDPVGRIKTILRIHGVYFESKGPGIDRVREFVKELRAAKVAKSKAIRSQHETEEDHRH